MVIDAICLMIYFKSKQANKNLINEKVTDLSSTFDKVIKLGYSNNDLNYTGFNNKNKTLTIKNKSFPKFIVKYDDIMNVELIENGKSTISLSNIIGGAFLAGGVGAIIGSASKNYVVESRKIKFTLNDFNHPSYEIILSSLNFDNGINVLEEVDKLMDTVKYIIGIK